MTNTPTYKALLPPPATPSQRIYAGLLRLKHQPLNMAQADGGQANNTPAELAALSKQLKSAAIDPTNGRVDYARLHDDPLYLAYQRGTTALNQVDLQALHTHQDTARAFWINLYNMLVIHAAVAFRVRDSIQEIRGVFSHIGYIVGGYFFSPDDIEHGILRANRGHPFITGPQFRADDPRCAFALPTLDNRIHFALVCGAASCPPIKSYEGDKLDMQLTLAARSFLNGPDVQIDTNTKNVKLSRILGWYGADFGAGFWMRFGFGSKAPILRSIAPYILDDAKRTWLETSADEARVGFLPYNWALNGL